MNYNDYRQLGFTTIQNGLIAYYSQLDITDQELLLIIQLEAFSQKGERFPSNEKIAANTNLNTSEVAILIQKLIEKNYLAISQVTDSQGKIADHYSLAGLYSKLDKYLDAHTVIKNPDQPAKTKVTDSLANNPLNRLSRQFEIEFGRYLSPIERQTLASWLNIDHYAPEIIELALREAVLSQAYSFKYVDRVLLNWQRHNLKTTTEVKQFLQRNR